MFLLALPNKPIFTEIKMNRIKPKNNQANMNNSNKGSTGTNKQNSQVHGNRSKQFQQSNNEKAGR
jgi:hypothetical protein